MSLLNYHSFKMRMQLKKLCSYFFICSEIRKTNVSNVMISFFNQWARAVGKKTVPKAVKAPLHSCEHYYLITKPFEGIDPMMPGREVK